MKKLLLLVILAAANTFVNAQTKGAADVNDKVHTRIIDGVVSADQYTDTKYDVKVLTEKEEVKLKLHYPKHVMLINSANTPIEDYIFVQNREKYLQHTLPDYVKLPIALNGKILSAADRKKTLPTLEAQKMKRIVFLNRASAQHKYANAPFGVIEVFN